MNKIYQKLTKGFPTLTIKKQNVPIFKKDVEKLNKLLKQSATDTYSPTKIINKDCFDFTNEEQGFFYFGKNLIKTIFIR